MTRQTDGGPFGAKKQATEEQKVEIRRLRGLGWSYAAIGREVGFTAAAIRVRCDPVAAAKKKAYAQTPGQQAHQKAYYEDIKQLPAKYKILQARRKAYNKTHTLTPKAEAARKVYRKAYRLTPKYKASRKAYRQTIRRKLAANMRHRLRDALNGNFKSGSAVRDLGCTVPELKTYLESLFLPGMTWDNWTADGWHIDHIKPLASFDLANSDQLKEACHFSNLQPLWAKENLSKGAILP